MPRKSARRPQPDACRIFHPNAEELIRALAVAFRLAPPPEPAPVGKPYVRTLRTQGDRTARERVAGDAH
jgi:hypothetical protein